jgi:hypothetical protein
LNLVICQDFYLSKGGESSTCTSSNPCSGFYNLSRLVVADDSSVYIINDVGIVDGGQFNYSVSFENTSALGCSLKLSGAASLYAVQDLSISFFAFFFIFIFSLKFSRISGN